VLFLDAIYLPTRLAQMRAARMVETPESLTA